jgi:hypothetical protein
LLHRTSSAARAASFCIVLVAPAAAWGGSTYPIQQQPGIWPPESPHVTYYTPPPGYPLATGYFYALQDIYNPAPADVYLDWMEVHAIVNGKNIVVDRNDYGSGPGQQNHIWGDYTMRSDMFTEEPGNIVSGWTSNAVSMQPSDSPSVAYSSWLDAPGAVPAGATDVYVEARMLVTGSAVAQIGLDYWNSAITANVNGAYGGFQVLAKPNWQIVTVGMNPTVTGDANLDGVVNGLDVALVSSNWLQVGVAPPGDVNLDGVVNGLDIASISSHWLQAAGSSSANAPEPRSEVLAILGMFACLVYWHCTRRGRSNRAKALL